MNVWKLNDFDFYPNTVTSLIANIGISVFPSVEIKKNSQKSEFFVKLMQIVTKYPEKGK